VRQSATEEGVVSRFQFLPCVTGIRRFAHLTIPAVAKRLAWLLPLLVILFARLWWDWGLTAAAVIAPAAALIGIVIGVIVLRRRA
jgi:hypothetical protein